MIYLDNQATTPLDPRVLTAMMPFLTGAFGNPHSAGHAMGREAAEAVETARAQVAAVIGAEPREIIFTSGATESNNLAIKGAARFLSTRAGNRRPRVVTLATEHKCVLESAKALGAEGFEPVVLPVEPSGLVDLGRVADVLDERVALVSVMAANNETGTLQDLDAIARIAHARGILFHTDAAQAFGKIPLDVGRQGIDLLSISGHKIYGPKGIGALYVRHRPRVRLEPLFSGGGQERGLRSGTLAPFLCVGLGRAAEIAVLEGQDEASRLGGLTARLLDRLRAELGDVTLNGSADRRLSHNLNIAIGGVRATDLLEQLPGVAISTGSACSSAEIEPSYVLTALGIDAVRAASSVRISLGRFTTDDEIDEAARLFVQAVQTLRG